jgi:antitoxin component YwqK of YwqJK toxin-antitoxin module
MKKIVRLTENELIHLIKSVINEETKKKGTIKYSNGQYTGEYIIVDGKQIKSGKGIYTWTSGERYEGNFKDDKFNGYGIEYYPSGKKLFEGNYKNGKFNGQGTYFWEDGSKYVGNFKNSKFNGYGIEYYPSGGKSIEGNFKNEKLNGQVTSYNEDGSIEFQGEYVNGKRIENSETKDVTTDLANGEYIVQKGDSLSKIGQKLGVNWKEIATLNNIKNVNLIRVGQKLKIPGKTPTNDTEQTNSTTVQTDIVSAYGPDVDVVITKLFDKMPSFKTFGKYVDKVGMSKGIDMTGIGTNLTVDEIKQKYPNELVDMPTSGFKFYSASEGRPFTKDTVNVFTGVGRPYFKYLNDVTSTPETPGE